MRGLTCIANAPNSATTIEYEAYIGLDTVRIHVQCTSPSTYDIMDFEVCTDGTVSSTDIAELTRQLWFACKKPKGPFMRASRWSEFMSSRWLACNMEALDKLCLAIGSATKSINDVATEAIKSAQEALDKHMDNHMSE